MQDVSAELAQRRQDAEKFVVRIDGLDLPLLRYTVGRVSKYLGSVLLLHGANTSSEMFLLPHGGLVRALCDQGYDVWTLDWRGSRLVMNELLAQAPLGGSEANERKLFTFDRVAKGEIPQALELIRGKVGSGVPLSLLGFCMGGGCASISASLGLLRQYAVHRLVLVTMGLFYETPWDGWLKAEDFILERVEGHCPGCRAIDPEAERWPDDLQQAYEQWPSAWLPPEGTLPENVFRRLTFMYGAPYTPRLLDPSLSEAALRTQFGPLHMGLYLHAGQMVRRGYAAAFGELDVIDRARLARTHRLNRSFYSARERSPAAECSGYLDPKYFDEMRVTLISAAQNRLWHRDSMDLMYEWLLSRASANSSGARHAKHTFKNYGHLDLFWSSSAKDEVFPKIVEGLT